MIRNRSHSNFCGSRFGVPGNPGAPSDLEEPAIPELESPTYTLDLRNPSNCLNIAMASPGEEIPLLVHPENDATAQLIVAAGTLSNDSKSFSVVITRVDGTQQTHVLCYLDLLKTLSDLG